MQIPILLFEKELRMHQKTKKHMHAHIYLVNDDDYYSKYMDVYKIPNPEIKCTRTQNFEGIQVIMLIYLVGISAPYYKIV